MADTYDVIICGAGSGGGYFAGEVAQYASVLILEAGPYPAGDPNPGVGSPERRKFSTQYNLGTFIPDGVTSINRGYNFFAYPMYMDQSQPASNAVQREARVVGGGSYINVGAWLRPRLVDWDGFAEETGVQGWTKTEFEPHFQKAEQICHVHRDVRGNWQRASVLYETTAQSLGIKTFENASNRLNCIFCGQRLNAGVPCKYDSLMGTAMTQIPKAIKNGATLIPNVSVNNIVITNGAATGVTYTVNGQTVTANANKLVVLAAGCIGTPLIMRNAGIHLQNPNVGKYFRAHPGISMEALLPGTDWQSDRGYQWNMAHYVTKPNGDLVDALVFASAGFATVAPWIISEVGFFGQAYKDLMRQFRSRVGAFIFQLKPGIYGQIMGTVEQPLVSYPIADTTGALEPKTRNDFLAAVQQVGQIYKQMGATWLYPNPDEPEAVLIQQMTQLVTTAGAIHGQSSCRAGSSPANSAVDTYGMSWNVKNLMCCDASVIPHHISSNPNSMIMALADRASAWAITNILGGKLPAAEPVNEAVRRPAGEVQ
jgi:choline dehydrogenase-like flavoprotein